MIIHQAAVDDAITVTPNLVRKRKGGKKRGRKRGQKPEREGEEKKSNYKRRKIPGPLLLCCA